MKYNDWTDNEIIIAYQRCIDNGWFGESLIYAQELKNRNIVMTKYELENNINQLQREIKHKTKELELKKVQLEKGIYR